MKEDRIYPLHVRDALERVLTYTGEGKFWIGASWGFPRLSFWSHVLL